MSTSNEHMLDFVDAWLHDALEPEQAAKVEQHCEVCPICRVALDEAKKRFAALKLLPASEAGEALLVRTEVWIDKQIDQNRVEDLSRPDGAARTSIRRKWGVRGVIAATFLAAAAMIGSLQAFYAHLSVSPYDLQVMGERELLPAADSSLRVLVFDRDRKQPLANVPITIELARSANRTATLLASFRTDARGTGSPAFQIPADAQGDHELRIIAHTSYGTEQITQAVHIARSWRLMVTSDKPVYQPGQTIHLRSLALRRPDRKPVAGESGEFRLSDPKGNVIFQDRSVTSQFGIMSTDCQLADEIIEGSYQIECRVGDTASALTVEVKKYVLPKFRITAELNRAYYAPGDLLQGTVECDYFFGQPVVDGKVSIEIRTMDVAPRVLTTLEYRSDTRGRTAFEYRLPDHFVGRGSDDGDARLGLSVTITDSAGQSQTRDASCLVTRRPLRLEVIPESGQLIRGQKNQIYVLATYADGQPGANVHVAVRGMDQELTTDALGVCALEFTPRSESEELLLSARDDLGNAVRQQAKLQSDTADNAFVVRVENPVVDGGQSLKLTILGQGSQPVFIDFIKNGQLLLTKSVEIRDGKGTLVADLPGDLSGTVQICAYRFAGDGFPVRKTQVIQVRPAAELQIEALADRAEYRPGETAKLNFRLRDRQGHAAPGALSLAAVDEAVFSVMSQRPGMEQTFFTMEEELLKPVYAIYAWSPNLESSAPAETRDRLERALFARTAGQSVANPAALEPSLPFRNINRRTLNVTKRRDWKQIEPDSGNGLHSLIATSLPAKQQQIATRKLDGQQFVDRLWHVFIISLMVVGFGWLAASVSRMTLVGIAVAIVVLGVSLMFPILLMQSAAKHVDNAVQSMRFDNNMKYSAEAELGDPEQSNDFSGKSVPSRVREWFPETLLWRPQLITDDQGRATIEVPLADSITTWRLTATAVTADGSLGAAQSSVRVFQPFFVDLNLPVALTRGDEVTINAVIYNYLDQPQTVSLELKDSDWFECLEGADKTVELPPSGVRSAGFPIRVKRVGQHELQINARGGELRDAIKKTIEVIPDGRPVERIVNGTLAEVAEIELDVPANAIDGSSRAIVKIYPSTLSQLVEGLEGIFQQPYGCFEQTSSTTYPNVLALDYLQRTGMKVPAVEAMARQYIHLGYQRLLTFEVAGGGFDWFGNAPANRTLTAYGLMEFEDMARVHDVDPQLIRRTRQWLLDQRRSDGAWDPEEHAMHEDPTSHGNRSDARFRTTAYIARAVFGGRPAEATADPTINFLLGRRPEQIDNPYDLALLCNALLAIDGGRSHAAPYLARLFDVRQSSSDGKQVWWQQPQNQQTMFYGSRQAGDIETTALAILAFLSPQRPANSVDPTHRVAAHRGLGWISARRDGRGTWPSTQATVLALKALLAGTQRAANEQRDRRISIEIDAIVRDEVTIPAWQNDVVKQVELRNEMTPGQHRLRITDRSGTAAPAFQVDFRYHVPDAASPETTTPLAVHLNYDRTQLTVNETVTAKAVVRNNSAKVIPMVVLDLPIPAGFAVEADSVKRLRENGEIAKIQTTPRSLIVYLRSLGTSELAINYTLRATLPVKTTTAPAIAYEYYTPENRSESEGSRLVVVSRE